jgi:hypothetical protein
MLIGSWYLDEFGNPTLKARDQSGLRNTGLYDVLPDACGYRRETVTAFR